MSDSLGSAIGILQPGLSEDVGIPSDDEEEETEKKKDETPAAPPTLGGSPFVFGQSTAPPKLVGGDEAKGGFGFGAPSTGGFTFGSVTGWCQIVAIALLIFHGQE